MCFNSQLSLRPLRFSVCQLYLKLYAQGIYAKVIRNQFASSPSLFVPSAPPCITYNSVHSVSQCALLCNRLGLGLHITEGLFLLAYWFFYGKQLISLTTEDVNYFHSSQNQYMLFRGLKDALSACKRCPFEVLLTPFWSPIKHLLCYYFITNWFPYSYKPAFVCVFAVIYWCFLWIYVMIFQSVVYRFWSLKMKRLGLQDVGVIRFATCV